MSALLAFALLASAGLALVLRPDASAIGGFESADFAMVATTLALLIFLGGPLLRGHRGGFVSALRDAVALASVAIVAVVLYSVRDDLKPLAKRISRDIMPGVPVTLSADTAENKTAENNAAANKDVRVRRQVDGQFIASMDINGVAIAMIVDTGASTVVLRADDASRAGIDLDELSYTVPVQTANGRSFAAHIRLARIAIGSVVMSNVEALIARPGALHQSLLGMSFLSRLRSYEFSGDFLTLRG